MLSRLVIPFLPRSKRLLISWLQSPSAVILEPRKIKSDTVSTVSPSICHEVRVPDAMILFFWMLSFKPTFSLSSFTFIKRLFSSSLSAMRVVSRRLTRTGIVCEKWIQCRLLSLHWLCPPQRCFVLWAETNFGAYTPLGRGGWLWVLRGIFPKLSSSSWLLVYDAWFHTAVSGGLPVTIEGDSAGRGCCGRRVRPAHKPGAGSTWPEEPSASCLQGGPGTRRSPVIPEGAVWTRALMTCRVKQDRNPNRKVPSMLLASPLVILWLQNSA